MSVTIQISFHHEKNTSPKLIQVFVNALSIELECITKPFFVPLQNESESVHFIMFTCKEKNDLMIIYDG